MKTMKIRHDLSKLKENNMETIDHLFSILLDTDLEYYQVSQIQMTMKQMVEEYDTIIQKAFDVIDHS